MSLEILPKHLHWDLTPKNEQKTRRQNQLALTRSILVKNNSKTEAIEFYLRGPQTPGFDLPYPEKNCDEKVVYRPYKVEAGKSTGFTITLKVEEVPNSGLSDEPAWIDVLVIFEELKKPLVIPLTAAKCGIVDAGLIFADVGKHFCIDPPEFLTEKHEEIKRSSMSTIAENLELDQFVMQETKLLSISELKESNLDQLNNDSKRSSRTSSKLTQRSSVTNTSKNSSMWDVSVGRPPSEHPDEFAKETKHEVKNNNQNLVPRRRSSKNTTTLSDNIDDCKSVASNASVVSMKTEDGKSAFLLNGVWCTATGEVVKKSSSPLNSSRSSFNSKNPMRIQIPGKGCFNSRGEPIKFSNSPVSRSRKDLSSGYAARKNEAPKLDASIELPATIHKKPKDKLSMELNWDSIPGI